MEGLYEPLAGAGTGGKGGLWYRATLELSPMGLSSAGPGLAPLSELVLVL